MSLILRVPLTRELTHSELDSNFLYLEIIEWVKKGYQKGQYIYRSISSTKGVLFRCETTHSEFEYPGSTFVDTITDGSGTVVLWKEVSGGGTVASGVVNGAILTLTDSGGGTVPIDFNVSGISILNGITTHGFIKLTESSFSSAPFYTYLTNAGSSTNTMFHVLNISDLPAKLNIVVIDLVTSVDQNFIVMLPQFDPANDTGKIIKFITKRNNISDINKNLLVASDWINGGNSYRIIAPSIVTKVNTIGYFTPLESLESLEYIFDGSDWLVSSVSKQQYVEQDAANYLTDITIYVTRDLDDLLSPA